MTDRFDLSREQPQKEWWRERPIAPATFFGFPDVAKHGVRGGSLYVEQMDAVTLAVLTDKCIKEGITDPDIWTKFAWRAQNIATRTHEPELGYLFRAFARADWFDQNLLTTYLGRLHRRLHAFQLPDVAVLLEAFANPRFRQAGYLEQTLLHMGLLLQHRDDSKASELGRCCAALRKLRPLPRELSEEVMEVLELLAEALLIRDLSELGPSRSILVIDCFVAWGLLSSERQAPSNASADLCWALVRELKGGLRTHGREKPDELATLAAAMSAGGLKHEDLWEELVHNLEHEAYRLTGAAVAQAIQGTVRAGRCTAQLYEALARRLHEECRHLSPGACVQAAGGFLRGPTSIAEKVVLQGPIYARILDLGLHAFSAEELTLLLDALTRPSPDARGVETMAGAVLEELHPRLSELSPEQLASAARSLGVLQPEAKQTLVAVLDLATAAMQEAWAGQQDAEAAQAEEVAEADQDEAEVAAPSPGPSPRHLAMLCQGIAAQPQELLPDATARLQALLPQLAAAMRDRPAALTCATVVGSLARCPASAERAQVLDACAARLTSRCHDLTVSNLSALTKQLAGSAASGAWSPPKELLEAVAHQMDVKRYDFAPGALGQAARKLEKLGGPRVRLEDRDVPRTSR